MNVTGPDARTDSRSRILDAARRLFADRGYAATSLADIAAEVGLTKTAVAYHFHPKDRIAAELLTPAAEELLELLGRDLGPDRRAFLRAFAEFMVRHRDVIRLVLSDQGLDELFADPHEAIGAPGPTGDPADSGRESPPPALEAVQTFRGEFFERVAGPDPAPVRRVRAWAAIGAVHVSVLRTMDLPQETVRETVIDAALAAYGPG